MSDTIATNFPPQTYSSSFYLNSLVDDEKIVSRGEERPQVPGQDDSSLLDCFVTTFLFGNRKCTKLKRNAEPVKTSEKEIDLPEIWKGKRSKTVRSSSPPHNAFKRWRKTATTTIKTTSETKNTNNNSCGNNAAEEDMSLLKFLAINALDLSAPASDVLLKSRSTNWFQLSGHPDSLAPAGPGTVWKKRSSGSDDTERTVYEELSRDPTVADIIPRYYREVEYQGEKFIELQDLLHGFQDPYVIDIKMGTRTFLESEVKKTTARGDLYQKMIAIDPNAPTEEEHAKKAVTKLRYMQFREQQSSTCSHGFRIEAMKCRGSPPVTDLKKVKSTEEVLAMLDLFLGGREDVRQRLLQKMCDVRSRIEQSEFFKTREVVGSSLFIIYDDSKVGVWLIDFAKTCKLPDGTFVNHRTKWSQGNYEEGLLYGFDRLISIIENIQSTPTSRNHQFSKSVPAVSVKS